MRPLTTFVSTVMSGVLRWHVRVRRVAFERRRDASESGVEQNEQGDGGHDGRADDDRQRGPSPV